MMKMEDDGEIWRWQMNDEQWQMEDEDERFKAIEYAWNSVNEIFGFDSVRKTLVKEFLQ